MPADCPCGMLLVVVPDFPVGCYLPTSLHSTPLIHVDNHHYHFNVVPLSHCLSFILSVIPPQSCCPLIPICHILQLANPSTPTRIQSRTSRGNGPSTRSVFLETFLAGGTPGRAEGCHGEKRGVVGFVCLRFCLIDVNKE